MSKFPNQLDDDVEIPSVNDNITEVGGEAINALRTAIFAIQSALGTDPQGSAADLKTRLAYFFEDDGTPKASALVASGLIALPVTNAMVAANAGIIESKLDLDVPTQNLQLQVSSNDVDIATLQILYNQLLFDFTQHYLGNDFRHDGYDIAFGTALPDAIPLDTVSLAIHYVWAQFLAHKQALTGIEHYASAISYTPTPNGPITATDVQGAISQMDTAFFEDRRRHDDSAHSDGISGDGYFINFGQFAVNDASARVARLPSSPNIIKLGLINGATIKSKGFDPNGIGVSSNAFAVEVSTGNGIYRSLNITGLQAAQYPTGLSRISLKAIVDYCNQQFQLPANHFPVTAFESEDGELVLQHNIAHPSCTIAIRNANPSAINQLGFTDVLNTISGYVENYSLHVDGYRYYELATLSAGVRTQVSTSSSADLGTITGPGGLGIEANMLFHVFNHSNTAANGTYRVVGTIINTVTLNTTLAAGTYNYIIYKDTIDSNFTGNFKTLDLYIDSNRNTSSSIRQETTLVQISGLKIMEVSQDLTATAGSMTLNFSSPIYDISLTTDGYAGPTTTFEIGYIGYKKIYASNNKSYVTVFIHDPAPSVGTDQITFYGTEKQDSKLLLGTTHTNAASVIEFPLNRRNVGLTGKTALGTEIINDFLEADIRNLHSNGVIRGLDIIQINSGGTSITLNGGLAYVEGRRIERERVAIDVTKVATSNGSWNLLLNQNGIVEIYNETTAGFAIEDILFGTGYLVLAQLVVSGGVVTDFIDGRFFINDIESKLDLVVDDQDFGAGQFRTLESAVLNSQFSPNNNKPEIKIISDLTIGDDVVINADTQVIAFKDLTVNGNLTLSAGAILQVFGALNVTGTTTIGSNCNLVIGGGTLVNIVIASDSVLNIVKDISVTNMDITGSNISIIGAVDRPMVTFAGTTGGIRFITPVSNVYISNMELVMTYSTNPIVTFTSAGSYANVTIENNLFRQSSVFTYPSPTASRQGIYVGTNITLDSLYVANNIFTDLSHGIEINSSIFTLKDLVVRQCVFTNINIGMEIVTNTGTASGITVEENVYLTVFNYFNRIVSNTTGSLDGILFNFNFGNNDGVVYGLTFLLNTNFGCGSIMCTSNVSSGPIISIGGSSAVISNNLFDGAGVSLGVSATTCIVSNNIIKNNTSLGFSISSGTTAAVMGNIFTSTAIGTIYSFAIGCILTCIGNRFIDGGTSASPFLIPNGAVFIGNYVQSGRIHMSGGATPPGRVSITSNNRFIANGLNGTNTFEVLPATSAIDTAIFSGNIIEATGTLSGTIPAVRVSTTGACKLIFSNNTITSNTGGSILGISSTSNQATLVTGNHLFFIGGSVARGAAISSSNVFYINNLTEGMFNTAEIDVSLSPTNVFVSNNILDGYGAGGKVITISATATATIAKNNKNAVESWTYSALNGLQRTSSDWTFNVALPTTFEIKSVSATSCILVIPLQGLPVGARIESVQLYTTTPGTTGTLKLQVLRRSITSHALTAVSASIDNSPSIFQVMTTGVLAQSIIDDNEYFVVLTSTAANNIIGQVVANIRI